MSEIVVENYTFKRTSESPEVYQILHRETENVAVMKVDSNFVSVWYGPLCDVLLYDECNNSDGDTLDEDEREHHMSEIVDALEEYRFLEIHDMI